MSRSRRSGTADVGQPDAFGGPIGAQRAIGRRQREFVELHPVVMALVDARSERDL
jgi:hypothetical protein